MKIVLMAFITRKDLTHKIYGLKESRNLISDVMQQEIQQKSQSNG
jgi:hypothetical protein